MREQIQAYVNGLFADAAAWGEARGQADHDNRHDQDG